MKTLVTDFLIMAALAITIAADLSPLMVWWGAAVGLLVIVHVVVPALRGLLHGLREARQVNSWTRGQLVRQIFSASKIV